MDVHEIVPYQRNPRDNAEAVASVAASIKEFGFRIPIVVDNDNVIVCGHTRVEAAKSLGLSEIPATRADGLSQKQIDAFRLIDNKVSELARWDFDLLAGEIQALSDSGINMTEFGWTREELDCLSTTVANDCLSVEGLISSEDRERAGITERRAPSTARFVLGELVFFIPAADYRRWVDGIRTMHDYNESAIIAELKNRLGVIEDAVEATQRVRRVRGAGAPNSH
jgi:hypothetical protein